MACSQVVQTCDCGTKCRQYTLTCRNLPGGVPCAALEGFSVTVTYDGEADNWSYTDGDGCESYMTCSHPDTNRWVWAGAVAKKIDGDCIGVLDGEDVRSDNNAPTSLGASGGRCQDEDAYIQVEQV